MASVSVNRKRALLSVTDKTGLVELAQALQAHDHDLIASGGTAAHLREAGLEITEVSDLTGYPAIFGGRVKTLHPVVHGGILGPTRMAFAETQELGIQPIDVVAVNLYRFEQALADGADASALVEKIDIGGPTLLRAAAKNFTRVTVLPDPAHYPEFVAELTELGESSPTFRRRMATAAFRQVERYDDAIAGWFETRDAAVDCGVRLRYGENPHQTARMFVPGGGRKDAPLGAIGVVQLSGKALSYNNIVDMVAALKLVGDFDEPCCGILKHTNPCGFALGEGVGGLERALLCDPVSAFGGVFAFAGEVDEAAAEVLAARFLEIIAAPSYSPAALARLAKKKNVRILEIDLPRFLAATRSRARVWGGLVLRQDEDEGFPELAESRLAAGPEPDPQTRRALEMVWKVAKHGKSNAIVLGDLTGTLGLGFGQMSRVDSTELAVMKAGQQNLDLAGCVAGSDGFFPFPDGIERLAAAGVRAVIAPGGSIRDDEVAVAADKLGLTFILTGRRHFNH